MMSSAGAISDMIYRIENNKKLLGKHRRLYEKMELYAKTGLNKKLEWNSLTEEDRVLLIQKLEKDLSEEKQKDLIAIAFSILITGLIILVLAALIRWAYL